MRPQLCQSQGWSTLRLDGSLTVKQRQPLVDRFNDPADPSFIFLLSSKAGGVGLNIIGANRLVLFDPGMSSGLVEWWIGGLARANLLTQFDVGLTSLPCLVQS